MPAAQLSGLAADVADALAFLHSKHVMHRDLKPSNILIPQQGHRACLCDFGIARYMEKEDRSTITGPQRRRGGPAGGGGGAVPPPLDPFLNLPPW